jgi:hypothetical protein
LGLWRWPRRRLLLTSVGVMSASASIVSLFLYGAGVLPMYFFIDTLAAPSLLTILVLGIFARRIDETVFLNRLVIGSWLGLVATAAYDAARVPIWVGGAITFDPFFTIQQFGQIITGYPVGSPTAIVVGLLYHYWNGFGFGVIYTLVAGPAKWYYGLLWALFLEAGWLLALPPILHIALGLPLVAVSLFGHAVYGTVLGVVSHRLIKS